MSRPGPTSRDIGSVFAASNQNPAKRVLVVDDEPDLRELLELSLIRMGLDVDTAGDVQTARNALTNRGYGLVLTDMKLPDGTGLDVVREASQHANSIPVAVLTAFGSAENAVNALKAGAFDYLSKPVSLEQLRTLVQTALGIPNATTEQRTSASTSVAVPELIGHSSAMQQVRVMIGKLARTLAPIAVYGESGTGKELAARLIHAQGPRAHGPFVAVNCGAIPETLMEAEFFGARKGAFTGADQDRAGFFQAAHNGTLFLDEVGELPLTMQVKLLRAIQERKVRRIGATQEEAVDVRIISATHRDLSALVALGLFRQDLFYRLNVIELRMPALREREDDIVQLAQAMMRKCADRACIPTPVLADSAVEALMAYDFPGNVRELENIVERAIALGQSGQVTAADLLLNISARVADTPSDVPQTNVQATNAPQTAVTTGLTDDEPLPASLATYLDTVEREILERALVQTHGNRTAAAQLLGLTFRQFRYRLARLGIR